MTGRNHTTVSLRNDDFIRLDKAMQFLRRACLAEYLTATTDEARHEWSIEQEACSALHDRLLSARERLPIVKKERA